MFAREKSEIVLVRTWSSAMVVLPSVGSGGRGRARRERGREEGRSGPTEKGGSAG